MARKRVLVTRAAQDAPHLARPLVDLGFEPVLVPLIEIRWHPFAVSDGARAHPDADDVLITSAVAADVVATGAPNAWRSARWAAVGPSTASRLIRHGYTCTTVPDRATGADLVAVLGDLVGRRIVVPRSDLADRALVAGLVERGAQVIEIVAYTNEAPPNHAAALRAALPVDATTLLSTSAAERLADAVSTDRHPQLGKIVAIGPSTARAAQRKGIRIDVVASPHTLDGVVAAVRGVLGNH